MVLIALTDIAHVQSLLDLDLFGGGLFFPYRYLKEKN